MHASVMLLLALKCQAGEVHNASESAAPHQLDIEGQQQHHRCCHGHTAAFDSAPLTEAALDLVHCYLRQLSISIHVNVVAS